MTMYFWNLDTQVMERVPNNYSYRSKWACFKCRKSFMRKRLSTMPGIVKCPDCGCQSTDMRHLFQAPPKRNKRQWKIMELLGNKNFKYYKSSAVYYINSFITGNNKLTVKEVQQNIESYFKENP